MGSHEESVPEIRIPGGFDAFYRQEFRAVFALTLALTRNHWVAEDIAQDAFLRAHRDWNHVSVQPSPPAWVRRVAINLAMSRFRRLRSETAAFLRLRPQNSTVDPLSPASETFWEEVRRLPKRQGQVIALHYLEDLPVKDIASILDIAEGTVKALLHQGRTRLARQLSSKGLVDDET